MVAGVAASLVFLMVFSMVAGEVVDVLSVRDALEADLKYAASLVGDDGSIASSLDPGGSLRAQALMGSMAASIHLGLGDPESLELVNRLAEAVNRRVESEDGVDLGFDGGLFSEMDNLLTHSTVANFLAAHYGLTGDLRSRANMLKIVQSLEGKVGWSPAISKSSFLIAASRISFISGGSPFTGDVAESLDELSGRLLDVINYSTGGFEELTTSLSRLSQLLQASHEAGLDPPTELVALWAVHIDYVINATEGLEISRENYPSLIKALSSLVDAAENQHLSQSQAAGEYAVKLAGKLAGLWRSGDRMLLLPVNVLDVYILDPRMSGGRLLEGLRAGLRIPVIDLRLPMLLIRLESAGFKTGLDDLISVAISRISLKDDYLPLVERGALPSEEFYSRMQRIALLATYLAIQRAPAVQQKSQLIQIFLVNHPSFPALLTILLVMVVLRRVGILRW
jgi:hypothetical protein